MTMDEARMGRTRNELETRGQGRGIGKIQPSTERPFLGRAISEFPRSARTVILKPPSPTLRPRRPSQGLIWRWGWTTGCPWDAGGRHRFKITIQETRCLTYLWGKSILIFSAFLGIVGPDRLLRNTISVGAILLPALTRKLLT